MNRTTKRTTQASRLSPADVIGALENLGITVEKEQGDEVYALCPMHESRTGRPDTKPSWSVNRDTGMHHCFSCGYSGGFVGLVMDVLGAEIRHAIQWVKKNGLTLDTLDLMPDRMPIPAPAKKRPRLFPESVLQNFTEPPPEALESRLVTEAAARHYNVLWDPEEGAWVFPIRWPDGVLIGYQWKKGLVMLNHPPRMRKAVTLFGADVIRPGRRIILVESPIDCVRLHAEGIEGAVSSFGASVSVEQVRFLTESASSVVLALDNDQAGQPETERLLGLIGMRLPTFAFNYNNVEPLPGKAGKDPGELTKASIYKGITNAFYSLGG